MTASDLLDDPDAIVGASGAGKSYTGRAKVEQLLAAHRHTIIFDPTGVWYGLRSDAAGTGPGIDIPIFGGPHGDVPVTPAIGGRIADLLLGERISAVIDLSTFEEEDLRRFALDFLDRLRTRERVNLHLVFDEAEEFAPQTAPDDVGFQLVRRMTWIAKRGRVFGLVPTFLIQRPADFAKAVLSQVQTLYFHQLIAPADQKPVVDYLKANADKATLDRVKGSLPGLERGQRWVYSPRRQLLELGMTAPIGTFDSMATPPPGESKREPRTLAQLDVSKIRAALAPPMSDPSIPADAAEAYQVGTAAGDMLIERDRRIEQLQSELADLTAGRDLALSIVIDAMGKVDLLATDLAALLNGYIDRFQESPAGGRSSPGLEAGGGAAGGDETAPPASPAANHKPKRVAPAPREGAHPMAVQIVAKLEELAPARLTWRQLASLLGKSPDGGYFRSGKRDALAGGAIVEEGDFVRAVAAPSARRDRAAALDLWMGVLQAPAPAMIVGLTGEPGWVFKGRLASQLGYSPDGGYFRKGLALLRQNGVTVENGNDVMLASPIPGES